MVNNFQGSNLTLEHILPTRSSHYDNTTTSSPSASPVQDSSAICTWPSEISLSGARTEFPAGWMADAPHLGSSTERVAFAVFCAFLRSCSSHQWLFRASLGWWFAVVPREVCASVSANVCPHSSISHCASRPGRIIYAYSLLQFR